MREIRTSGSEGGGIETNRRSLPLSVTPAMLRSTGSSAFADDDTAELAARVSFHFSGIRCRKHRIRPFEQ